MVMVVVVVVEVVVIVAVVPAHRSTFSTGPGKQRHWKQMKGMATTKESLIMPNYGIGGRKVIREMIPLSSLPRLTFVRTVSCFHPIGKAAVAIALGDTFS